MIFHPSIIALYLESVLISFMIFYSSYHGVQILRGWDLKSGSELQLILERKTYLISTILTYLFGFQLISLFLFIFTTDHLHTLFVGAMCSAGTLYVNAYGYPALIMKVINFLLAGLWLIVNHADNRAYDYPLIRKKYFFLLIIAPLIFTETILQANYFLRLSPAVITSCCGTLFSSTNSSIPSEIAALPRIPMKAVFYFSAVLTIASGIYFYRRGKGGYLFSSMTGFTFVISIAAILSFISLYFYELPTHHCPFCILQGEYGYIGYPLYLTLLGSAVSGIGVGFLMPFRNIKSLSMILPSLQRKLTFSSLILLFLFTFIVTYQMVFSDFKIEGY